jgi:hypothetical protein
MQVGGNFKYLVVGRFFKLHIDFWWFCNVDLFERPEEFLPERFLHSETGMKEDAKNAQDLRANLPFGAGRVRWLLVYFLPLPAKSCFGSADMNLCWTVDSEFVRE